MQTIKILFQFKKLKIKLHLKLKNARKRAFNPIPYLIFIRALFS